eukprot:scaffold1222_cov330-Prasinococcus_capsulatus_cf.AAC.9
MAYKDPAPPNGVPPLNQRGFRPSSRAAGRPRLRIDAPPHLAEAANRTERHAPAGGWAVAGCSASVRQLACKRPSDSGGRRPRVACCCCCCCCRCCRCRCRCGCRAHPNAARGAVVIVVGLAGQRRPARQLAGRARPAAAADAPDAGRVPPALEDAAPLELVRRCWPAAPPHAAATALRHVCVCVARVAARGAWLSSPVPSARRLSLLFTIFLAVTLTMAAAALAAAYNGYAPTSRRFASVRGRRSASGLSARPNRAAARWRQ